MRVLYLIAVLMLLSSPLSLAQEGVVSIFVTGTIGVELNATCIDADYTDCLSDSSPGGNKVTIPLGEEGGCLITVNNKANIKDVISIKASLPDEDPNEGWVRFSFTCIETVGECNGTEVRNMQITPDIQNTSVFLAIKHFKVPDPGYAGHVPIILRGFSHTNSTVESLGCVWTDIRTKSGFFSPLEAPLLDSPFIIIFSILLAGAAYHLAVRKA